MSPYGTKKDAKSTRGLFSCINFILQVHECIQQENDIISINPNNKHNFINVNLAKRFQSQIKHIQTTYVEGENVKKLKYFNIMDTYVLHSDSML